MKSTAQAASGSKTDILKTVKSARRKASGAAKRTSRAASKLANEKAATAAGYSAQGQRLVKRGKAALLDASRWAGAKASSLPKSARSFNLPDQKALQTMAHEKPLFLAAVGLGVGVVIGSLLPSMGGKAKAARRK